MFALQARPGPAAKLEAGLRADSLRPAARQHVRIIDGEAVKFTSKLATMVELNFTMGNGHQPGKKIISDAFTRLGASYGFQVKKFASASDGSQPNVVPAFTLDDLLSGEVLVANNVSGFGNATLGVLRQDALRAAIETHGRGYLAFHGSGDNQASGWPWYTTTLHPLRYNGSQNRSTAPVYKHLAESRHVVLEGILDSGTTLASVPDELDASGSEVLAHDVPTRRMKSEWFRWGRDISRDSAYRDKVTVLLKYDPRALGNGDLDTNYRRKGGGLFTYLYKVGAGMTSYVLPGHENDELLDRTTGFDGGVGDFERYVAQTLFFLAGYRQEPCDSTCLGLPLVDGRMHLMDGTYDGRVRADRGMRHGSGLRFAPGVPGFALARAQPAEAELRTAAGEVVRRVQGRGPWEHRFEVGTLNPGVYVLSVRIAGRLAGSRIYAIGS